MYQYCTYKSRNFTLCEIVQVLRPMMILYFSLKKKTIMKIQVSLILIYCIISLSHSYLNIYVVFSTFNAVEIGRLYWAFCPPDTSWPGAKTPQDLQKITHAWYVINLINIQLLNRMDFIISIWLVRKFWMIDMLKLRMRWKISWPEFWPRD